MFVGCVVCTNTPRVPPLLTPQTDIPGESKFEAFLSEMQSIRESLCEVRQDDEEPSEGTTREDGGNAPPRQGVRVSGGLCSGRGV